MDSRTGMFVDLELVKTAGFGKNLAGALASGFKWPGRLLHGVGSIAASKPGVIAGGAAGALTGLGGIASIPLIGGAAAGALAATPVLGGLAVGALAAKGGGALARGIGGGMKRIGNWGSKAVDEAVKNRAAASTARAAKEKSREAVKDVGPGLFERATNWAGEHPLAAAGAGVGGYLGAQWLFGDRNRGPQIMGQQQQPVVVNNMLPYKQGSSLLQGMVKEANLAGESLSGLGKLLRWPLEGPGRALSFLGERMGPVGKRMVSPGQAVTGGAIGTTAHLLGMDPLVTLGLVDPGYISTTLVGAATPLVLGTGLWAGAPVARGVGAVLRAAGAPGRYLERKGLDISARAALEDALQAARGDGGTHMFVNNQLVKAAQASGYDPTMVKEAFFSAGFKGLGGVLTRWGTNPRHLQPWFGGGIRRGVGKAFSGVGNLLGRGPTVGQAASKIPGISSAYRHASPTGWARSRGMRQQTLNTIANTGASRSQAAGTLKTLSKTTGGDLSSVTPQQFGRVRSAMYPKGAGGAGAGAGGAGAGAGGAGGKKPKSSMQRLSKWFKGLEPWQQTAYGLGGMYAGTKLVDSLFGDQGGQTIVASDGSGSSHIKFSSVIPDGDVGGSRMFVEKSLVEAAQSGMNKEAVDPMTGLLGLGLFGAAKGIGALRKYFSPGRRLARRIDGSVIDDLVQQEAMASGTPTKDIWKKFQQDIQGNIRTYGGLSPELTKAERAAITADWATKRGLNPNMPVTGKGGGGTKVFGRNVHPAYMVGGGVLGAHLLSRNNQQQPMIIH